MIFIKPLHNNLYHLASHLSTLGERESEESECDEYKSEEGDESKFEPLTEIL